MIDFIESGLRTIKMEVEAVGLLSSRVDQQFSIACETILACQGRVIVTGMGKSGHIGNKIAATLASTGTPAFFVHPGEASHGDLGMITKTDVVIAISNSGNTNEIVTLLPLIARLGIPLILALKEQTRLALFHLMRCVICASLKPCRDLGQSPKRPRQLRNNDIYVPLSIGFCG